LHCTGVGKALLAQLDDARIVDVARRTGLPAQTPRTITDPAALAAEIARIRAQGFAVDDGEQEIGVHCVAAAVVGAPSPMAISVSGPTSRLTSDVVKRAAPLLVSAAEGLAADLLAGRSIDEPAT
jgi:IclR family acetate operon transcriptional repressor